MLLHRRRGLAAFIAAFVLLLGLAPLATAGKDDPKPGGMSSARLEILDVKLTNAPVAGNVRAALGIVSGDATTVEQPFASIALDGVRVGDQNLLGKSVKSNDADNSKKVDVPLTAAGIDGALTIAELAASATEDSATSTLAGLDGELTLGALGLTSDFGGQGIVSRVTPKFSTSSVGVDVGPIALQLGDLLPAELLEALPFSTIVSLAGELKLDVVGRLREVRGLLREINAKIDAVQETAAELGDAKGALDALIAGNPEIAALQAQVDAARAQVVSATATVQQEQATLADLTAQKSALEADLLACLVLCDVLQAELTTLNATIDSQQQTVAAAQSQLATATASLTDAEAALAAAIAAAGDALQAASALVDQLQAELDNLLDTLEGLLGNLPNLDALIQGALDALKGAPLVSIGRLNIGVETVADAERGVGKVACSAQGVKVLGTQLGAMSCSSLQGEFGKLQSGIFGVLGKLPVAGSVPQPTVAGLETTQSGSAGPDDDGRTSSKASITALRLGVPSVELQAVVDTLVADLIRELEGLAASTPLAPALDQVLTTVLEQLDSLPTGDLLRGLRTVGVDAAAGGLSSASEFVPPAEVKGGNQEQETEEGSGPGSTVKPHVTTPQERAALPFTGSGYVLAFTALALLTMVAGATLTLAPTMARGPRATGSGR